MNFVDLLFYNERLCPVPIRRLCEQYQVTDLQLLWQPIYTSDSSRALTGSVDFFLQ